MANFLAALQKVWGGLKGQWPAIVMAFMSYEEARVKKAQLETDQAKLDTEREKHKSETLDKYADGDDADVLRRAIIAGGGSDADVQSVPNSDDHDPAKKS